MGCGMFFARSSGSSLTGLPCIGCSGGCSPLQGGCVVWLPPLRFAALPCFWGRWVHPLSGVALRSCLLQLSYWFELYSWQFLSPCTGCASGASALFWVLVSCRLAVPVEGFACPTGRALPCPVWFWGFLSSCGVHLMRGPALHSGPVCWSCGWCGSVPQLLLPHSSPAAPCGAPVLGAGAAWDYLCLSFPGPSCVAWPLPWRYFVWPGRLLMCLAACLFPAGFCGLCLQFLGFWGFLGASGLVAVSLWMSCASSLLVLALGVAGDLCSLGSASLLAGVSCLGCRSWLFPSVCFPGTVGSWQVLWCCLASFPGFFPCGFAVGGPWLAPSAPLCWGGGFGSFPYCGASIALMISFPGSAFRRRGVLCLCFAPVAGSWTGGSWLSSWVDGFHEFCGPPLGLLWPRL